jgi:FAD/FMN-containing dehydrogenase
VTNTIRPTRRSILWSGTAASLAFLAACTHSASDPATGSGSSTPPTSAPTTSAPTTLPPSSAPVPTLAELSASLPGKLLMPAASGFAAARSIYNPRFDTAPAPTAIALCADADDVAACVRFAAAGGAPLRIRAGGHSYGGWSGGPGLVCDISALSAVTVDAAGGTARIGAGAKLAAVYSALADQGVALAAGSCPTVGIGGLALGGGVGVLTRAYGLTCDAIRSAQIVTADGAVREVSASQDPDLFWAIRGGGGSFGAVTAFTMAVQPAPAVSTFYLSWDISDGAAVLGAWQTWIAAADSKLWSTCKLLADPGDGAHANVSGTWIGAAGQLSAQLAPLLSAIGVRPSSNQTNSLSYGQAMLLEAGCYGQDVQSCLADALGPDKRQPFAATSAILESALPAAGIAAAIEGANRGLSVPGIVEGGVSFDALGGAVSSIGATDTPFPFRSALASIQFTATWPSAPSGGAVADPAPFDAYVQSQRAALAPWTGPSAYVNYADSSIVDYGPAYWGANYARLQDVKKHYDPANVFSFPQSVRAA